MLRTPSHGSTTGPASDVAAASSTILSARVREAQASRARDPSDPISIPPPMGVTIPPLAPSWRLATIVVGTVVGVAVLLLAYSVTVLQTRSAASDAPAVDEQQRVDLSSTEGRAHALGIVSSVIRADAPKCMAAPPDEIGVVFRGDRVGRLEVASFANVLDLEARACLKRALGEIAVVAPLSDEASWPVSVTLSTN